RERADWIVGMNATRLFSCLYGQTLNVGRVMTPTLAMVVMRDAAIQGFREEPFYTVHINADGITATSARFKEKMDAEKLVHACRDSGTVVIQKVEQKEKTEKCPQLYDLTSLQRDANRRLGYTAQQTLNYTQSLYEKKLVTYPRTDSRFLTEDMEAMLPELVRTIQNSFDIQKSNPVSVHGSQVINGKKVSDHHAIIPTKTAVGCNLSELPAGEREVFLLIARRLICAVADPYRYLETKISLICGGQNFSAKGREVIAEGWKLYDGRKSKEKESEEDAENNVLPSLLENMQMVLSDAVIKEGKTSPPKHFTEDTLLSSMETAGDVPDEAERQGIGTPATRAGIIEKLVQKGYIERQGDKKSKHLVSTHKGNALVTVIPEQIQSPSMTADWEEKLLQVERGQYEGTAFMDEITHMISDLVKNYELVKGAEILLPTKGAVIGNCPVCGSEITERPKGWFCSNQSCHFSLWKDNNYFKKLGKQLTPKLAEELVKKGKARLIGCKSARTGRKYDATVVMNTDANGRPVFELRFDQSTGKKQR
ncbi:MAG: DNA topoisomerase, partial [Anaerovoracaceae bacterium]